VSRFYKGARPDGWDFYTEKTINYREAIGKVVHVPTKSEIYTLCTPSVIHASRKPQDVFVGSKIPLSLYIVEGTPVVEDDTKSGFKEFKVLEEIPSENFPQLFGFEYDEVLHPLDPRLIEHKCEVSTEETQTLKTWASVRASVRDSVWDSVRASVWASVRDSVWASVRDSVWDSVRASVWASVWASVRDSVWDSVWASEAAYVGHLFERSVKKWKYTEKVMVKGYPFQSCVDLLKKGLVPATNGTGTWYLSHPIKDKPAEIMWKGKLR